MIISTVRRIPKQYFILLLIALVGFIVNLIVFFPGYMSNDSFAYFHQAQGWEPYNNLRPILTAAVWSVILYFTDSVSSILIFQVMLIWVGFLLIATYILKKYDSFKASLSVMMVPFLPYVFNISGVLWSDVLHVGLMILGLGMTLWLSVINERWRLLLLSGTIVVFILALMVRYNTAPAVVPLVGIAIYMSKLFTRKLWAAAASVVVVAISAGILVVLSNSLNIQNKELTNGPKLDDIINLSTRDQIARSGGDSKSYLLALYECANKKGIKLDVINSCKLNEEDVFTTAQQHSSDIDTVWKNTVGESYIQYLTYKISAYTKFLIPSAEYSYIWHDGVEDNKIGIAVKYPFIGETVYTFITNLVFRYFPFLYAPWFWLTISLLLLYKSFKSKANTQRAVVVCLVISSILVILSYFPTSATVDYRYIYWPAIASTIATILLIAGDESTKSSLFKRRVKNRI